MADFTPITTQEQFDSAIGERLKRERETLAKKYADYDDLKKRAQAQADQIDQLTRAAQENAKKYAGYDDQQAQMQAKIREYETASVKTRVAMECGLPYAMSARLAGETEEEIRRDAQALAKLMGTSGHSDPPRRTNEPDGTGAKRNALREWKTQLTNND